MSEQCSAILSSLLSSLLHLSSPRFFSLLFVLFRVLSSTHFLSSPLFFSFLLCSSLLSSPLLSSSVVFSSLLFSSLLSKANSSQNSQWTVWRLTETPIHAQPACPSDMVSCRPHRQQPGNAGRFVVGERHREVILYQPKIK